MMMHDVLDRANAALPSAANNHLLSKVLWNICGNFSGED